MTCPVLHGDMSGLEGGGDRVVGGFKIPDMSRDWNADRATLNEEVVGEERDVNEDGGILKTIVTAGRGFDKPLAGTRVTVHYVGTLSTGEKFDASRDRGKPFEFDLGKGQVIKGWDQGVATMRKGEKALFKLRHDYAYGKNGKPPTIPGEATLHFEVELLDFSNEVDVTYGKKTVMKRVLVEGEDWKTPGDYSRATVRFSIETPSGEVIATSPGSRSGPGLEFAIGEGTSFSGFETAVRSMKKNEYATFTISGSECDRDPDCIIEGLPERSPEGLKVVAQMVDFVNPKDSWELTSREKVAACESFKNGGTEAFKAGKFKLALAKYEKARELGRTVRTPADDDDTDPQVNKEDKECKALADALVVLLHLNIAACHLKLKNPKEAAEACTLAIKMDKDNVKAHYRRAEARRSTQDFDEALQDIAFVLEREPNDAAAKTLQIQIKKEAKAAEGQSAEMMKRMTSIFK